MSSTPTVAGREGDVPVNSAQPDPQHARGFRPDIEGLRAIAVGTVLLYHAGLPFFHGGFVGVDVFFVISGFLITGLLVAELERTGHLSIAGFYARRIKRLLPATVVVLLSVCVLAWLFLSPLRRQSTAGDVASSALYSVNWRLAGQAVDYLAQGEDPSPVQHFWSLAVEEQFYVVWPVLLLIAGFVVRRRGWPLRPTLFAVIGAISVPSFIYSVRLTHSSAGAAYFSSLTRAWELGVGAALAIIAPGLHRLPSMFSRLLGWAGVAAILWAALSYSDGTPFPGHAALTPVLGAGAVIAAGVTAGAAGPVVILGTPLFRHVGRLSYSWYLWHWPLIVIAEAHWGHLGAKRACLVLAVSYFPTLLTNRFIEEPFRRSTTLVKFPKRAFGLGIACMASVLVAAFLLNASVPTEKQLDPNKAPGAAALPSVTVSPSSSASQEVPKTTQAQLTKPAAFTPDPTHARADLPVLYADGCQRGVPDLNVSGCVFGDPKGSVTIGLLGDSHAAQWFPPLERLAVTRHWRLVSMTKSGCTPSSVLVYNITLKRAYTECSTWRMAAIARLTQEKPKIVLVTGSFGNDVMENGKRLSDAASAKATQAGLAATLEALTSGGSQVLVLRDTPRMGQDIPECVSAAGSDLSGCTNPRSKAFTTASSGIEQAAADLVKGAHYADLDNFVCPSDPCPPIIGDVLVYRDGEHLTATYAKTLAPALATLLDAAM